MTDRKVTDDERRTFLINTSWVVGGAGLVAASWPFVRSMYPSAETRARGVTSVNLNHVKTGDTEVVSWQGKPVFVVHRTSDEIRAMKASSGGSDPQPDAERTIDSEWLVVVGICTHLGCIPNRRESGWLCPCHGSAYDNSGRVIRGPAPRNLVVPPYRFTQDDTLVIGERS